MVDLLLIATLFLFVFIDAVWGCFRRNFFGSIMRLVSVVICAFLAYLCAQYIGDHLMQIPIGEARNIGDVFEELLISSPELVAALQYSDTIDQLVRHLPEIMAKELLFVPFFAIFRLISLPVIEILNTILFGGKRRREKAKKKHFMIKLGKRLGGLAVGALQGFLCFCICLVPIFGFSNFAASFADNFKDSQVEELASFSETVDNTIAKSMDSSITVKALKISGIYKLCDNVFYKLSHTTMIRDGQKTDIYYFETLENAFPAVSAFLLLQDMDPEHMTTEDYRNLNNVFVTAKDSEEVSAVLKDVTGGLVASYVEEEYQESAKMITDTFVEYVLAESTATENLDLELEMTAIENILSVMNTAVSEGAESAFEVKSADTVVDSVLNTEATYETLVGVVQDEEKGASLRNEINMEDVSKEKTAEELKKYRDAKLEGATPEQSARINELVGSVADLLGVTLD